MKRSTQVSLAMAGTAALAIYMATRPPACDPNNPNNPQPCRTSNSSSSSGRTYWGGGSSSSSSTSSQTAAARGGFGATGSAVSGHGGS